MGNNRKSLLAVSFLTFLVIFSGISSVRAYYGYASKSIPYKEHGTVYNLIHHGYSGDWLEIQFERIGGEMYRARIHQIYLHWRIVSGFVPSTLKYVKNHITLKCGSGSETFTFDEWTGSDTSYYEKSGYRTSCPNDWVYGPGSISVEIKTKARYYCWWYYKTTEVVTTLNF